MDFYVGVRELIYCGVVFDGFLQRKQAKVTQRVETAIRAESTATWNEVKVGVESSKISSTSSTTSIFSSCSVARRRGPIEIKWLSSQSSGPYGELAPRRERPPLFLRPPFLP